jgi:hypothetical protein
MKQITIWLNKTEYRQLLARARQDNVSPYAFIKKVVRQELGF